MRPSANVLTAAAALLLLCLAALPAHGGEGAPAPEPAAPLATYTNPLPVRMADPFVLKHEGRYYLYGTSGRGFRYWTSTDLVHWTSAGNAMARTPESWGTGSFWAPEVVRYRDKFYMVYSCQRSGVDGAKLCLAAADAPGGPFVDLHAPWFDIGWACIDGDIFIDDDGTPYLFFDKVGVVTEPAQGEEPPVRYMYGVVYGAKLKDDLSGLDGEPVLCIQADRPWEDPTNSRVRCNEGAFVIRHNGAYYMTYSSGQYADPAYSIGYATAKSPLGPWTKPEGNRIAATDLAIGLSGPGHNSITTSPDGRELFIVYHSHADAARPGSSRVLNIDRLVFGEDGSMKVLGPTRSPQPAPSGAETAPAPAGAP